MMKWRNQLLALSCLLVFFAFGVLYFRHWVVQKPFGIILFIGAGLDPARLAAARVQAAEPDAPLAIDSLPYSALLSTYGRGSTTPDQAAAASALATGVRIRSGAIGVNANGKKLVNLLELARKNGRMTGLVTNALLTDPTPASFYAHTSTGDDRHELARELVEDVDLDVVLGGGAADFLPSKKEGRRSDEKNLLLHLRSSGFELVQNLDELEAVPRWRAAKLFGIFAPAELAFADEEPPTDQPRLSDLVRRSIELLQFNSGGYVLVVDAGLMRKAAQDGNSERVLLETIELDRAVSVALEYAGTKSTILVCGDVVGAQQDRARAGPALESGAAAAARVLSTPSLNDVQEQNPSAAPQVSPSLPADSTSGFEENALNVPSDVIAFGTGLGADALHGTLASTAIFEIIRDNL